MTDPADPRIPPDGPDVPLYPIREELIHEYVTAQRADLLISLFNSIKVQRDRAETSATIYQTECHRLAARLAGQTPVEAHKITTSVSRQLRGTAKPMPAKPPTIEKPRPAVDLDKALDI